MFPKHLHMIRPLKRKPLLLQKRRKYYNFHRSKLWNFCVEHSVTIAVHQRRLCLHFAFLCHSFIVFRLIQNFCLNRITSSAGVGPRYKNESSPRFFFKVILCIHQFIEFITIYLQFISELPSFEMI